MPIDEEKRVSAVVRQMLAYATGIPETEISESTKLQELSIDSVSAVAFGLVLQAELEIEVSEATVARLFDVESVAEMIAIVHELVPHDSIPT